MGGRERGEDRDLAFVCFWFWAVLLLVDDLSRCCSPSLLDTIGYVLCCLLSRGLSSFLDVLREERGRMRREGKRRVELNFTPFDLIPPVLLRSHSTSHLSTRFLSIFVIKHISIRSPPGKRGKEGKEDGQLRSVRQRRKQELTV